MKNVKSILGNKKGFSLVELMVSIGIASIVSYATMSISTNSQKTLTGLSAKTELMNYMNINIENYLKSSAACTATMTNNGVSNINSSISALANGIYNDAGVVVVAPGSKTPGGKFTLDSINLTQFSPIGTNPNLGVSQLEFTFSKNHSGLGARTLTKTIPITITMSTTNTVSECVSAAAQSEGLWDLSFTPLPDLESVLSWTPQGSGMTLIGTPPADLTTIPARFNVLMDGFDWLPSAYWKKASYLQNNNALIFGDYSAALPAYWGIAKDSAGDCLSILHERTDGSEVDTIATHCNGISLLQNGDLGYQHLMAYGDIVSQADTSTGGTHSSKLLNTATESILGLNNGVRDASNVHSFASSGTNAGGFGGSAALVVQHETGELSAYTSMGGFNSNKLLNRVFFASPMGSGGADGNGNIALGNRSLIANTSGKGNSALGLQALLRNTTGSGNTAVGRVSLWSNTTGINNTAIGNRALLRDSTGSNNTAIGMSSLEYATAASSNTAIGSAAGYSATGSGNVFIGNYAGFSETGSNKLYIANTSTTTPLIHGDFLTSDVTINGNLTVTGKIVTDNWTQFTVTAPWSHYAGLELQYILDPMEFVHLRGGVRCYAGASTTTCGQYPASSAVTNLPAGIDYPRPLAAFRCVRRYSTGTKDCGVYIYGGKINVLTTGPGVADGYQYVMLDGITWKID